MVTLKEHIRTFMSFDEIQVVDREGESHTGKLMQVEDDFIIIEEKNATVLIPFRAILSVRIKDI